MPAAERLDTDTAHWAPVTRHYQVDGGYLAVTVHGFLTATGTDVYYCNDRAVAFSMTPIASFPDGTSHTAALESLGYSVIDTIGEPPPLPPQPEPTNPIESVLNILPPEIAAMIMQGESG